MKNKTLSDKRELDYLSGKFDYPEEDLKEFIKVLEVRMLKRFGMSGGMSVMKIIKEETGDKLNV